jgi:diamine N-acetyltransferase
MQIEIVYKFIPSNEIDLIQPLWERLRDHHRDRSTYFKSRYEGMTFEQRKADLLKKTEKGQLHIDIAENAADRSVAGYCISSVTGEGSEREGEVDSLFVKNEFRHDGVGDQLMKLSLQWMGSKEVLIKRIIVAEGNEEVFTFYQKHGFYHLFSVLQQK